MYAWWGGTLQPPVGFDIIAGVYFIRSPVIQRLAVQQKLFFGHFNLPCRELTLLQAFGSRRRLDSLCSFYHQREERPRCRSSFLCFQTFKLNSMLFSFVNRGCPWLPLFHTENISGIAWPLHVVCIENCNCRHLEIAVTDCVVMILVW